MNDKTNNLTIFLQEIADVIREIKGITTTINPQEFASLIRSIAIKVVGNISSDNVITLLSNIINNGTYTLKYEDSTNTPIDNFSDICTLTVNDQNVLYSDFIDINIPSYLSEYIGVYSADGSRVGYILLSEFKPQFGERLYRFGLLSDVHDYDESDAYPSDDFNEALSVFNDNESVEFTCICGDITQNGTEAELQKYKTDVQTYSPNTPVYTTTGNHDCVQGASAINEALWKTYTGQNICFELSKTLPNGNTDHFLFFGMTSWSLGSSGTPYNDTNITWLENKLESYKNERCFVFTHLFFPDRAGNLGKIYPYYNWLGGSQLTRIQALCDKYVNSIWFSGHSHWKWYLQKYEDNANIYRAYNSTGKPTCGWCVHVPSCASPIDSDYSSTGTSTSLAPTFSSTGRVSRPLESEGAVVDVYENYVDIRGIVFKGEGDSDYVDKYLPIATYRLDTSLINISADNNGNENLIPDGAIRLTSDKFYLSGSNEGSPTVEDDGDYLVFNFDAIRNRFLFTTSEFTSSVTKVTLYHSGYELSSELDSTALSKIGFNNGSLYGTAYTLESGQQLYYSLDDTGSANNGVYKIECNVSSSYSGQLPITVRIKNPYIVIE